MKELATHLKDDVKGRIVAQVPKQTEYALMGVIKPKPGHTIFEFNLITGESNEAKYRYINADWLRVIKGDITTVKELIVKENHVYIPALNKMNAKTKYNKSKIQSDYYKKEPPFKFSEHFI